ncbi:MAG: hypothetical protein IKZ07_04555 [Akkermansia sp.]|jgi:hypothetical protein|nr:hypothetical protein [Akkermansia sp.]
MKNKTAQYCIAYSILIPAIILLITFMDAGPLKTGLTQFFMALPAIPCAVFWLWIQRGNILSVSTIYICVGLPLLLSILLPLVAGAMSGLMDFSYSGTLSEQILALIKQNIQASIVMILLTMVGRWISGFSQSMS